MKQGYNSRKFFLGDSIPSEQLNSMIKSQKLWGITLPKKYGGLELNATQTVRACEEFYADRSLGIQLIGHIAACEQVMKQQF